MTSILSWWLEEYTAVWREGEASGKILPTTHGTSQNGIRKAAVTCEKQVVENLGSSDSEESLLNSYNICGNSVGDTICVN